jgi:hypothetical protein
MIRQVKWNLETVTRARILENWMGDGVVNRGPVSNLDRVILVKEVTPIAHIA